MKYQTQLLRALQFLRITDTNNNLSISNIAIVATLVRLMMIPNLTVHDIAAFLATVVGYQIKRFAQSPSAPEDLSVVQSAIADLQTKVAGLQLGNQVRRQ